MLSLETQTKVDSLVGWQQRLPVQVIGEDFGITKGFSRNAVHPHKKIRELITKYLTLKCEKSISAAPRGEPSLDPI